MGRAFLTGSHAYGRPGPDSDIDLVVLAEPATADWIADNVGTAHAGSAGGPADISAVFGRLNLISVTDPAAYAWWAEGTRRLRAEGEANKSLWRAAGVTRARAIEVLENLKRTADAERARDFLARERLGRAAMADVKLLRLVGVKNTRPLWPADFEGKIRHLEAEPDDRARWGVTADWLDENGEPELAAGFRYVFRKPDIKIYRSKDATKLWCLDNLPPAVSVRWHGYEADRETPAGLAACIYYALERARADL